MPGVKPEDLEIDEHEGILTIRAKSDRESEGERYGWHIQERRFGMYQRTLRIPVDVKSDKAKAELLDGILTISLPKVEPAKKAFNHIKVNLPKGKLSNGKMERTIKVSSN